MFRPVVGAKRYDVSDHGLVFDRETCRYLVPTASGRNSPRTFHASVSIVGDDGMRKNRYVHQLVLRAHVGPWRDGWHGIHHDDQPAHNCVGNLAWGTPAQNARDTARNGGRDRTRHEEIERERLQSFERLRARIAGLNAELEAARAA